MSTMSTSLISITLLVSSFFHLSFTQTPSPTQTEPSCPNTLYTPETYDRRSDKSRLQIVAYNVEFLFHLDYACSNPALDCPGEDCRWANNTESEIHMSTVANVIDEIDADIYMLAEVQDCCILDYWYQNYFTDSMKSRYNYYLVRGVDYYTGQNMVLLTKIDPINDISRTSAQETYPRNDSTCSGTYGDDYQGVSKHLIANLTNLDNIDDVYIENFGNIVIIGIHFLAQPSNSARCGEREAQATVIENIVEEYINILGNNIEFIILGDFNDYDKDWPDRHGHTPITNVLKYLKESGNGMINTAQYVNKTIRFTHWPQSSWEFDEDEDPQENPEICLDFPSSSTDQYDYVLISKGLQNMIENVTIGWQYCGTYQSDHYPVIVNLVNMGNDDGGGDSNDTVGDSGESEEPQDFGVKNYNTAVGWVILMQFIVWLFAV